MGVSCCFNPRPRAGGDAVVAPIVAAISGVSIHAPARGATCRLRGRAADVSVSIHAPARGATLTPWSSDRAGVVSIHAPARGATSCARSNRTFSPLFQSTPPRGGRPIHGGGLRPGASFNPRPRAGGDSISKDNMVEQSVSIHAPARGATSPSRSDPWAKEFQSTPPRGGRPRGPTRDSRR